METKVVVKQIKRKTKEEMLGRFRWQFNDSIAANYYRLQPNYKVNEDDDQAWDYAIIDKETDKPVMLVEIDWDGDGLPIPSDDFPVQFIYQENYIDDFQSVIQALFKDYDDLIMDVFMMCRDHGFPYKEFSNQEMIKDLKGLIHFDGGDISTRNNYGDKIIINFHRSIWSAHNKGSKSPIEAWENDELILKVIENRTLYQKYLNPSKILQGFNVTKSAGKVSVFSAGRAKLIIEKYLSNYTEIFDPFSGFSGRMLGAFAAGKKYIGQDLSPTHVAESNKIIEWLNQTKTYWFGLPMPTVTQADIFESSGQYQCLFTCSPYSDKEVWCDVEPIDNTCDEWIDICLAKFDCQRYVFVVDKTKKYEANIVDDISNRSHFNTNKERVVVIDKK